MQHVRVGVAASLRLVLSAARYRRQYRGVGVPAGNERQLADQGNRSRQANQHRDYCQQDVIPALWEVVPMIEVLK